MMLTQESEIVTTGCHGRQKIATRAGLVVTKEVLPGAEERGEGVNGMMTFYKKIEEFCKKKLSRKGVGRDGKGESVIL